MSMMMMNEMMDDNMMDGMNMSVIMEDDMNMTVGMLIIIR